LDDCIRDWERTDVRSFVRDNADIGGSQRRRSSKLKRPITCSGPIRYGQKSSIKSRKQATQSKVKTKERGKKHLLPVKAAFKKNQFLKQPLGDGGNWGAYVSPKSPRRRKKEKIGP